MGHHALNAHLAGTPSKWLFDDNRLESVKAGPASGSLTCSQLMMN
jgi:hypothetical protein